MPNHFLKPTFKRGFDEQQLDETPLLLSAIEPSAGSPMRYVCFIDSEKPGELLHGRLIAVETSSITDSNDLIWPITVLQVAVGDETGAIRYIARVLPSGIPGQFQFVAAHAYLKKAMARGKQILAAREVLK